MEEILAVTAAGLLLLDKYPLTFSAVFPAFDAVTVPLSPLWLPAQPLLELQSIQGFWKYTLLVVDRRSSCCRTADERFDSALCNDLL